MEPKKRNVTPCSDVFSTRCVVWNGPNIPCLSICNGDTLSDVVAVIANKVCESAGKLDLESITLPCLLDEAPPENKDLKTLLQLLIDSQCSLKAAVDAIDSGGSEVELSLNLRCIKKFDSFGKEILQDLNQTLQSIVDRLCTNTTDIAALDARVDNIQDQIDNLNIPDEYTEPNVTICTTGVSKPTSQALVDLANDVCEYKEESVGNPDSIDSAIAKQPTNLNSLLGATPGWDSSPATLAESFGNLWIAYKNLLDRIRTIETTCCGPTCDKIKLGFIVTENEDGTIDMNFTRGAGTSIPAGFEDCGSVITLTDSKGVSVQLVDTVISQDGVIEEISLASLATGKIDVKIKTKFCLKDSGGETILVCQDCVNLEFENTMGCCVLTNTDEAPQTIIYKITLNT